jgi:hypothetical protein
LITRPEQALDHCRTAVTRQPPPSPARAPKPTAHGPGRPPGSKNRRPAPLHTWDASWPPARLTLAPPTTRRAPSPAGLNR